MAIRPILLSTLFFLLFNVAGMQVASADVVAIFACDTLAPNIERAVQNDLNNMREEARRIAFHTEQQLKELIYDGEKLNPQQFLKTLYSLSFTEDDIILFYFSGHGYRTHSKDDSIPWPNLFFSRSGRAIDYSEVLEILSSKNQRFLLAIADCCNNFMDEEFAPPLVKKEALTKENISQIQENYRKLFLETRGEILITSSDVSEFSWCLMKGAIFTLAFLDLIKEETIFSSTPEWNSILLKTTEKIQKHQTPVFELHLK